MNVSLSLIAKTCFQNTNLICTGSLFNDAVWCRFLQSTTKLLRKYQSASICNHTTKQSRYTGEKMMRLGYRTLRPNVSNIGINMSTTTTDFTRCFTTSAALTQRTLHNTRNQLTCIRSHLKWMTTEKNAIPSVNSLFMEKRHKSHDHKRPHRRKSTSKLQNMKEDIRTIPNLLTFARMCSAPLLGYLVIHGHYHSGLAIFTLAGITDLLDGYIARRWKSQMSVLGTALDPLADKLLICVLTVSLTVAHLLPVWLTAVILLRDIALVAASAYTRYSVLPPPVNTVLQLSTVGFTLAAPVFGYVDHSYLHYLWYVTACTTVASGLGYWIQAKKSFSIIKH